VLTRAALLVLALGCEPNIASSPPSEPFDPFRLPPVAGADPSPGLYHRDADGDGYVGTEVMMADADPDGSGREWLAIKTTEDCDDDPDDCGAGCHPGWSGADICDGWDQDCDGSVDENPEQTWYLDRDGDGAGDPLSAIASCDRLDDHVERGGDCDDDPQGCGAACDPFGQEALSLENCGDGLDNDCDGSIDAEATGCDDNRPPMARFVVDPGAGSVDQPFSFDGSDTRDPEDPIGTLSFSWDFDGDGVFELLRTSDPRATWTFAAEGTHRITLRVEDPRGLAAEYTAYAIVSPREQMIVVTSTTDVAAEDGETTLREAIVQANSQVGPNTIVFAGPMTIALTTGSLPVITDADTTIAGRPGVQIRGTAASTDFCLEANTDRATFLWFDIGECPEDGIEMHGTSHWIGYVRSHDNGDDGVDFSSGSGNRIGPQVEVWNNNDAGFELEGEMLLVEQSRASANGRGVRFSGGIPALGTTLLRNTIIGNDNAGVTIAPAVDRISIWQNTIYGNGGDGLHFDAPAMGATAGSEHDVRNNVFAGNGGSAIQTAGGFASLSSNAFFDNAFGTCEGCDESPNGIESDPALVDPGSGDFRLMPGSPCIDAGEDLGLGYLGEAPDLGAFEHD
jgi:PKD repeat protein